MAEQRVLVTGATGFVGTALCRLLHERGYIVRAALRSPQQVPPTINESVHIGEISGRTEWDAALEGVELVVHTAARVHEMRDRRPEAYWETNVEGTRSLALAAERRGVQRMVFISTIKVNGEHSEAKPFTEADLPAPKDVYGESKMFAERALMEATNKMQWVVVRPPLVYGPGVRANFLRLLDFAYKGWPLPLGALDNKRSLVSVWNLSDFILQCLEHACASNRVWLVSDGADLSTPELVRMLARAMHKDIRLPALPLGWIKLLCIASGKAEEFQRLANSLQIDITCARSILRWNPPINVEEGIARTVKWYEGARR